MTSKLVISSAFAAGAIFVAPTIGEAALGDRTLSEGMSHSDVKELQDVLKGKGYFTYHTSTGYFGTITKDALIRFQRENNLPATGIADAATVRALQAQSRQVSTASNTSGQLTVTQVLRNGSRGAQVTLLQNKLKDAGYHTGSVDGIYGPQTAQSVRSFQQANNLLVDGIAGRQTLTTLNAGGTKNPTTPSQPSSSSVLRQESRGQAVTKLQNDLKSLGFFTANATGYYGSITVQSVRDFQRRHGLVVDGIAGPATLGKVADVLKKPSTPNNPAPSPTVLKKESRGQAVTKLQNDLKRLGHFSASATGYYGDITVQSVRSFQRTYGLVVDGIAGPATLNKLAAVINGKDDSVVNDSSFNVMNVIADASDLIGVRYVWGGNSPQQGFDCSGFIVYVYNKSNVQLPRTVAQMWNTLKPVSQPQVGDIVVYNTTGGPSHAGIYIGNNKFIQAGSSTGVVISDMNTNYWSSKYMGARRPY